MEEFYVADPITGRVLAGETDRDRDDLAVKDVENGVLFRYHPEDDREVRSQFVAVDGNGARERRVAVTKFGSDRADLDEHDERLAGWAEAFDMSVPGSTGEWSSIEDSVQRFHKRLISNRGNASTEVSEAFDGSKPVTVDAPQVGTAADLVNHALKFEPGSIAVSLHGRTEALSGVDIVIHAEHGESVTVHTTDGENSEAAGGADGGDEARPEAGGTGSGDTGAARSDPKRDEGETDRSAASGRVDDDRRHEATGDRERVDDAASDQSTGAHSDRHDRAATDRTPSSGETEADGESASTAGGEAGSTADEERSAGPDASETQTSGPDAAKEPGAAASGSAGEIDAGTPDSSSAAETADESAASPEQEEPPREPDAGESGPTPVARSPVPADATVPPDPFARTEASTADESDDQTEPVSWFPAAPGLSVFDGPTGRLVYDESGRLTTDETYGAANDVYLDDLLFYHNPAAGEVIAYTNGRVGGANQQLLVHYLDPDADDLIREFRNATERLFADRSGWAIARDVGNYQAVFNGLDDDATAAPAVSAEELDSVLRPGTRLDFGTPSAREAIEFVTYLRDERGFDGTVAISGSGRADFLDDVDVVVMPSSLNYTDVEPRAQTGDRIAFARLADSAATAKREFREVRKRSVDGEALPRRWQEALATAVSEASERAPTLRPAPAYRLQQASKALVAGATAVVLFLAALGYLAWSGLGGAFVAALTEPVTVRALPGVAIDALSPVQPLFVPLWGLLAVVGGIVAVGAGAVVSGVGGVRDVFKPLAYLAGGGPDSLDPKSAGQLRSMRESIEAAGELIDEVDDEFLRDRLNEWYEADEINAAGLVADEPGDQYLEVVFEHATGEIDVVDPATDARRRREWLVTGVAGGVAVGAVVAAVTVGVAYAFTAELGAAVFATVLLGQVLLVGLLAAAGVAVARRGD